jgi:hypothetical protein
VTVRTKAASNGLDVDASFMVSPLLNCCMGKFGTLLAAREFKNVWLWHGFQQAFPR